VSDLFHYTTKEFAEEVLRDIDQPGVYAEVSDGTYGPGFYALNLGPDEASRDALRLECFRGARPDHSMDGVLVLESGLAVPPFEFQEDHIWLVPSDGVGRASIGHMVVAVGVWKQGRWLLEQT
jgi:hypothetical protein